MALTDHQAAFGDVSPSKTYSPELLQLEDELDRVQMDIDAGRMSEARSKFVNMDRALRETPRALILRAKSSPSRDSHDMIASVAREAVRRTNEPGARIQLAHALALCGDREWAFRALPGTLGLTASQASARRDVVAMIGHDPEKAPDVRTRFQRFADRWFGVGS